MTPTNVRRKGSRREIEVLHYDLVHVLG
jgi:hypothetical protein